MKIYKVGGAVRDQLLGRVVTECDWVVVGGDPNHLIEQGYKPVGKEFPVFLHPKTGEEYALARTERKTGQGYTGFACYAAPNVTLEQDLQRRDLTINAMALDKEGHLVDPYGGQADLKQRILRHVSPAFVEDPLRVLRVARFASKLAEHGFQVAPETLVLMKTMVENGELEALTPERVWKEWHRVLTTSQPQAFFQVLADCGAKARLFPALDLKGVGMQALNLAASQKREASLCFAVLLHEYPEIKTLCQRYRVPKQYQELAQSCQQHGPTFMTIKPQQNEVLLNLIEALDGFRKKTRWQHWCLACQIIQAVLKSSTHMQDQPNDFLQKGWEAADQVTANNALAAGLSGPAIRAAMRVERLQAIATALIKD